MTWNNFDMCLILIFQRNVWWSISNKYLKSDTETSKSHMESHVFWMWLKVNCILIGHNILLYDSHKDCLISFIYVREKGRDMTQSYDKKNPYTHRKTQKQPDNTFVKPKTSTTQRLRTDLGRLVWVTIATHLAWLRDPNLPTNRKNCVIEGHRLKKM